MYLEVVGALTATFVAVALFFYLPFVRYIARWYVRRTIRRLQRAKRFLGIAKVGRALWLVDVVAVGGMRVAVAAYGLLVFILFAPILLTIGAFWLACSTVVP